MRRASPPIQQFAAAAAADATTATAAATTTFIMSSSPPHRGRGRGPSGRPYSGGRGQFVTGDAHFRSVRDANLGFRRGERGSFSNQTQYPNPPYNPRPPSPHHQNPRFRHAPPQFRPSTPFDHKQSFRPPQHLRSRPPDYRDWEPATTPPPPNCERFTVLSYNILADYLALDHRNKLYFHIPRHMLDWQWRKRSIVFELGLWSADILCLQEVDRFQDLVEELKLKGYSGVWKMRTGNPVDGCAIFWRTSRFKLLYEECIEFNKLGLRDNVAQICVLESINRNGSLPSSMKGSSKVVICNIHVLYNPNRGEIKLGQVRVLLDRAKAVSKIWNDAPVVICGDFNCTPKSPLYNFISEQKLYLSGIDRDKVSGQASATIRTPRLSTPKSSERSANGSVQAMSIVGDKEVDIEQSNSLSDMQNPYNKDNSSENQCTLTVLDMSDKSWTNVQCGTEVDTYVGKDTQQPSVDIKIFGEADSVNEELNPSYSIEGRPIDHINDEIHGMTPMTSSALEVVHTDKNEKSCTEHISDAVSTSNQESLSKKSNLHVPKGNEHIEFDCFPPSFQEDQSSNVKKDLESTDLLNVEISSTTPSSHTSDSEAFEVPHPEFRESPSDELITDDQTNSSSTSYLVDASNQSINIDFPLDEKPEQTSLDQIDEVLMGSENIGGDDNTFISVLNNANESVALDLGPSMKSDLEKSYQSEELDSASNNLLMHAESNEVEDDLTPSLNSISIDAEKTTYNPSLWTPVEIETATGNAECTFLEHPLLLRSTYTEVMDCSGTRDPNGEPLVTSYNRCFLGTVDYIWRSEGLQTIRVLAPMPKHAMEWTAGFPTKKWGSDHIALVSELAFLKDGTNISRDVDVK